MSDWRALYLPRTVVIFGLVSFLNDAASEMVTPLLPMFLIATLGAGPAVLGLMEGLAEAAASLLKLVAGRVADRTGRHKRLILGGYGLSNSVRPLLAFAPGWSWVITMRFLDRIGKGLRTAPRDAFVAAAAATAIRGRAFGFHRAMDHAGAMLGPLLAFALLSLGFGLRDVFLISVVPGFALMLLLLWGVPARPAAAPATAAAPLPRLAWSGLEPRVRALVLAAGALAFATAPDLFLILWAQERGLELALVPLLWAVTHALRSVVAAIGGLLSDRLGRLPVVIAGWSSRVGVLVLLAAAGGGTLVVWLLFLAYGAATALTEGAERALIADLTPAAQKATAFGWYHMVAGLVALPGALLFGVLWQWIGMEVAFGAAAVLTAVAAMALLRSIATLSPDPAGDTEH